MRAPANVLSSAALLGAAVLGLGCAVDAMAAGAATPPLPPPRPDRIAPKGSVPNIRNVPEAPGSPDERAESDGADDESGGCYERLAKLGAKFKKQPARNDGACKAQNVVLLSELAGGIAVSPPSPMVCAMAEALARWTAESVNVSADEHLKERPTKLIIGTSYECRNQRSGGKLSEHAFANGVDVMGFAFAKRSPVAIGSTASGSVEATFQAEVRQAACPLFTTVLGPGSDPAHHDHLHLDLRGRKAGYRICQ